jgi:transcriptional regulator with XRE-family HTH domain
MRQESEVWQALLRRKGLSVTDLAAQLGVTRQHAHRLLTGRRPAETQRDELESALALGSSNGGHPLYAIGELDDNGELDLVPAGDAQPLFRDRDVVTGVAHDLEPASRHVCVLPVWPTYAWRTLVGFHAAWGAEPEPRKVFVVDATDDELPARHCRRADPRRPGSDTSCTRAGARLALSAGSGFSPQRLH